MRPVHWLALTVVLLVVGAYPQLAPAIGHTLGLIATGAGQLLAQPVVFGAALLAGAATAYRTRRTP